MTRVILYGGKGGVGKTTCAAATALGLARDGQDTLVVSTDPAHSLSDAFEQPIESCPTEITDHLWAVEIDPDARMAEYEAMVQTLFEEFEDVGVHLDDADATALFSAGIAPGSDEVAALDTLVEYLDSDRWASIVLDTAPTGHTLRLLDTPEVVGATVRTAMSLRAQVRDIADRTKRLFLGPAYYMTGRERETRDRFAELQTRMKQVAAVLRDPDRAEFRVVLIPERLALAETDRLVERLRAVEMPVGRLVVNRVLEDPDPDCGRCRARHETHREMLAEIRATFPNQPVLELPECETDVHGMAALEPLADRLVDADQNSET